MNDSRWEETSAPHNGEGGQWILETTDDLGDPVRHQVDDVDGRITLVEVLMESGRFVELGEFDTVAEARAEAEGIVG